MEQLMQCRICFNAYHHLHRIPYVIPCGHTFCKGCLEDSKSTCPVCRKTFSQMSKNFEMCDLIEKGFQANNIPVQNREQGKEKETCAVHKRETDRFCKTCVKLMCSVCRCDHLNVEGAIISDENLKDEVRNILKSYTQFEQRKETIIKETNEKAEKLVQKISSDAEKRIAEIIQEAERKKDEILLNAATNVTKIKETKDLRQLNVNTLSDYAFIYKEGKYQEKIISGFIQEPNVQSQIAAPKTPVKKDGPAFQLKVKTMRNEVFQIEVRLSDTIGEVKDLIAATKGFDASGQKLINKGRILNNSCSVKELNIIEGDFLVLMYRGI